MTPAGRGVNLLPEELREKPPDMRRLARLIALTATAAALMLVTLVMLGQTRVWERRAAAVEAHLAALEPQVAQVDALMQETEELRAQERALQQLMQRDFTWYRFLDGLAGGLPPHTWLTEITTSEDGRTAILKGASTDLQEIGLFLQAVGRLPEVNGAKLVSAEQADQAGTYLLNFTLEVQLNRQDAALAQEEEQQQAAGQ